MNVLRVVASLLALLWVAVPLVSAVVYSQIYDDRLLQESSRQYVWVAGGALIWVVLGSVLASGTGLLSPPSAPRGSLMWLLLGGAVGGAMIGLLTYHVVNTAGLAPSVGEAEVQFVARKRTSVRLRTIGGPWAGLEFACSNSKWVSLGPGVHRIALRQGPLGLWWGELR